MIDRARCTGCGRCAQVCRTGALEIIGRKMTVEEVFHELIKDQKYYGAQGGVTLSGGEAMLQREFSLALLDRCREAGIHCALECNGLVPFEDFEAFLPRVDLFLLDYKATQAQVHLAYVGCDNARVLDNLRRLHEAGALILLRCPIIPGVNDDHAHLDAIARLTREFPRLVGAEILPYHKLGVAKAERIGSKCVEFEAPDARQVDQWKQYILEQGGRLINVK